MAWEGTIDGRPAQRRRWSFADCIFDEASWSLTVAGRRIPVETKPLVLLRALLLRPGDLVSKDDLLDAVWRDVTVVEASLPTAVRKLRSALGDDSREVHIIETVPRIGYRLAAPVTLEDSARASAAAESSAVADEPGVAPPMRAGGRRLGRLAMVGGIAAAAVGLTIFTVGSAPGVPSAVPAQPVSQQDAMNAIRRLDVDAIERMLAAGWNPNLPIETEGNAALHAAVEICEWHPGHDRNRLVLMVRTLMEGGGRLEHRNVWGDTPYSIAASPRYCGPDHPVTRSLRATCFDGFQPLGDRCLASYELERRARR